MQVLHSRYPFRQLRSAELCSQGLEVGRDAFAFIFDDDDDDFRSVMNYGCFFLCISGDGHENGILDGGYHIDL